MTTQAEIVAQLDAVLAQQQKTAGEIGQVQAGVDVLKQQVSDLEAIIAGMAVGEASAELVAKVAEVSAQAQVIDNLIPDTV